MIEQGEANCVIVKDLSRLGREYIETGRYMRRVFPAYGVRFIAINDNVDTENDAADDLTVSVKNIMNEAYCRDISVKTRSALEVKRRSGDFVGAFTIYGYVKVGDKHKSLEVDEYAANVVRDIFRKRLEGFSASHIADELNRLGILSPLAYNKKRGCSVENQKLVLNDFLSDKPDFVVYDTYIDNGATGTNFHRPGFQQMLSDIEAGHINCVIVKDLSRLGRNSIDTGYYIEQYFHFLLCFRSLPEVLVQAAISYPLLYIYF